ncbi:MAG: methyl-accepting chemotaxis protein [Pseudolabrys sp.]
MSADVADAASARNDRNPSQRQRDGAASVTGPISDITSVTEAVAAGDAAITIPFTDRRDEIGALARSIGIFQTAMRKNVELNRTVLNDADLRQQHMAKRNRSFIFGGRGNACRAWTNFRRDARSVDATRERCRQCLSQDRTCRGDRPKRPPTSATLLRLDELSASVNEIDRQVAQSNAIANKAVNEVESTNLAVKELDEAAGHIGDVIKLITDIAEQTNLLALNATIEAAGLTGQRWHAARDPKLQQSARWRQPSRST